MAPRALVIGGGIIGCAVAHELARRGCRVELVADRALARGATQASGGMLVPYVEVHGSGPMLDLSVRSLAHYDEFIAQVRSAIDADAAAFEYTRNGSLQVAFRDEDAATLQDGAMWLGANRVACDWLSADELRRMEPSLANDAVGALLVRDHGVVAAEALTEALWQAACAYGASYTPAHVTGLRPDPHGWTVNASGGQLHADVVVLAPGAWAGAILIEGVAPPPVTPIRGQLLRLHWPGEPLQRVIWGPRCYLIPWRDRTLLVGATLEHVGFDERNTVAGVHDLLNAASELVPHVWKAGFVEARAGLRPGTPDDLPIIGTRAEMPGLFYAAGHYRNGVLLAPITAKLLGDLIMDGTEDDLLRHFSPERFGVIHA
jgi:glycine oxidase